MENKELIISKADLIKSISNPVRLCIVKKLTENETCNVRYLTNCMDISQSGISQHLGKLRDLVTSRGGWKSKIGKECN